MAHSAPEQDITRLFAQAQWRVRARFWRFMGAAYDITAPDVGPVGYATVAPLKLREDIRVYDRKGGIELLRINARNIIDFSGHYDVTDSLTGRVIGGYARMGLNSMVRDHWRVIGLDGQPVGTVYEDSVKRALLRRFALGGLLPQCFYCDLDPAAQGHHAAVYQTRFSLLRHTMDISLGTQADAKPDARMVIAGGLLLAAIEGSHQS
jgi:hypothetical protein